MRKIGLLVCVLIEIVYVSCDYPGLIEFVNETNNVAYFNIYKGYSNTKDTLKVELTNHDKIPSILIGGYGHSWDKENINKFISDINKIELISENDTLIFTDKDDMYNYLK
ncbi:hypothetical protein, partial [Proteiniphilum sp. X52]|uniref:hypothetical protein n=1 Tax=Proteiniphilum sp. X52 TaxID=2382159 RepID=UPI000F41E817